MGARQDASDISGTKAELEKQDQNDEEAFANKAYKSTNNDGENEDLFDTPTSAIEFKRGAKRKKGFGAILGIKRNRSAVT